MIERRTDEDFDRDSRVIPTTLRRDFRKAADWATNFNDRKVIATLNKRLNLYCGAGAPTFDAQPMEFSPQTQPRVRPAQVVRGAVTDRHDLASEADGLLAISVGLARIHCDDHAQLNAGMALYDALCRWMRDGFDEGQGWPADRRSK